MIESVKPISKPLLHEAGNNGVASHRRSTSSGTAPAAIDADALASELRRAIKGEVRFDAGSRALYATDASNYRQVPIGVVIPRTIDDVAATVSVCRSRHAPLLSRGGGTSLAGECCNAAVVMDWSKYLNRVISIDRRRKLARVQPGCVLDKLRGQTEEFGLTFGPDPATHTHNTLGGMIGNDSCGIHSIMAVWAGNGARTAENIETMDILLYDGTRMTVGPTSDAEMDRHIRKGGRVGDIYRRLRNLRDRYGDQIRARFPNIPRRVSGYNLEQLLPENGCNVARALVGSEGTLVTVLEATCKLIEKPKAASLVVLGFPDVFAAADAAPKALAHKPMGLEGMDELLIDWMKRKNMHPSDIQLLPEGKGWLLCEFGADTKAESDAKAARLVADSKQWSPRPSAKLFDDPKEEKLVWEVRESGLGATADVPGEPPMWPGWEDSAVPPDKIGPYLRDLNALMVKYDYKTSLYGHFGQGCIHCRIPFDLKTADGVDKWKRFLREAADLVVSYGGSLSGEHGDGQARAWLLPVMFGDELMAAMREFKEIWDPDYRMNPGKVIDANQVDENMRLGPDYSPATPETHFSFPDDGGSFAQAMLRCVGVGNCRRESGGVMCPSYMATREEKDSTRGRARLLFEMLQGAPLHHGWRSEAVKESLDLCLACKGCTGQCPVNVDIPTYKAEFLSHYWEGRARPRSNFAFGFIHAVAHAVHSVPLLPVLVNAVTSAPGLSLLAKVAAGMQASRRIPKFADQTFRQGWARREAVNAGAEKVVLFPDTFNDHFHPDTAMSAALVLEAAGRCVIVPAADMCCGRPLYDYGFLTDAKAWLLNVVDVMRDHIQGGVPIVVLEPSCASVFRDEARKLLPGNEDAKRLAQQTYLLSEYLEKLCPGFSMPQLKQKALVHGHCHHKSVLKFDAEEKALKNMGLDFSVPDPGCCGMAGAFGFEAGKHYETAQKCGERALLPAVRAVDTDTLIVADGFSCREMISQNTKRSAVHLADVLRQALGLALPNGSDERADGRSDLRGSLRLWLPVLAALAIGGALAWVATNRRK